MALAHLYAIRTPICSQLKSSLNNPLRVALATKSARTPQQLLPSSHRSQVVTTRAMSSSAMKDMVNQKIKENPIIVMSKSYCPYCTQVKSLFKELKVPAKVIELDQLADGDDVQDGLTEISKMRTFPQVFIKGALVGGCDDTMAAYRSGQLKTLLEGVGVSI